MSEDTAALVERVRGQARSVLQGEVGEDWQADWVQEWATALDSLTAALERAERERDEVQAAWRENVHDLTEQYGVEYRKMEARAQKAEAVVEAAREALTAIRAQQPETLEMIRSNGFVFDDIGNEPGNWQHLAFTIYNDLCRVETLAAAALAALDEQEQA